MTKIILKNDFYHLLKRKKRKYRNRKSRYPGYLLKFLQVKDIYFTAVDMDKIIFFEF